MGGSVAEWLACWTRAQPGFKSQPQRCRVTVLGNLFTPIVPLFTEQPTAGFMIYVTCRLTAKNWDQLRNHTLHLGPTSFSFELSDGTRSRRRFAQAPIAVGSVVLTKHVRLVADRTPLAFVSRRNQREIPTQQWRPHCAFKLFLRSTQLKQVQHPPSAVNVTLPAFVAERRRLQSRSISPASGALSSKPAARRSGCRLMDRRTDGRTDVRPFHKPRCACCAGIVSNACVP